MQNFRALRAPPQTPVPAAGGGFAPRPKNQPLHCEFLATRLVPFLVKTFFWSSPEIGEKKCSIFGEDLFLLFT